MIDCGVCHRPQDFYLQHKKENEMGMDLTGAGLSYNWWAWRRLLELLASWCVDVSELTCTNDGDLISEQTCLAVADAIEVHLNELSDTEYDWLEPHIELWRNSGGVTQW
jgi:hypothetical protein